MTRLDMAECSPGDLKGLLRSAANLAQRIADAGPAGRREILLELIDHIQVRENLVRVILKNHALHSLMGDRTKDKKHRKPREDSNSTFALDLEVTFKRRGVGMKLILSDDRQQLPMPDPKLIAAVSAGRRWFAELKDGKARSVTELAEDHGVDRTDIGRLMPLAFLAPDIVEAILRGRQPIEFTVSRWKRIGDLPVSWPEQRRVFQLTR